MSLIFSKTYQALKALNIPEAEAVAAAEELTNIELIITDIRTDLKILKWLMVGLYGLISIALLHSIWLFLRVG